MRKVLLVLLVGALTPAAVACSSAVTTTLATCAAGALMAVKQSWRRRQPLTSERPSPAAARTCCRGGAGKRGPVGRAARDPDGVADVVGAEERSEGRRPGALLRDLERRLSVVEYSASQRRRAGGSCAWNPRPARAGAELFARHEAALTWAASRPARKLVRTSRRSSSTSKRGNAISRLSRASLNLLDGTNTVAEAPATVQSQLNQVHGTSSRRAAGSSTDGPGRLRHDLARRPRAAGGGRRRRATGGTWSIVDAWGTAARGFVTVVGWILIAAATIARLPSCSSLPSSALRCLPGAASWGSSGRRAPSQRASRVSSLRRTTWEALMAKKKKQDAGGRNAWPPVLQAR